MSDTNSPGSRVRLLLWLHCGIFSVLAWVGEVASAAELELLTAEERSGYLNFTHRDSIASRNDLPIFDAILERGLASISPAERAEIRGNWINLGFAGVSAFDQLLYRLGLLLAIMLVAGIAVSAWIYSIRRQVAYRTQVLNEDLDERERIEELNHRLVSAVEQSAEFVVIVSNAGVVEYANLAFMLASGAMDANGKKLESFATDADQEIVRTALNSLESSHVWRGRVRLSSGNVADIEVAMTITRIRYDTIADGFVATGRDISHEEELEARLRHGEKLSALGTLAGGIAHDFNNLLVPIISYSDLVREEIDTKLVHTARLHFASRSQMSTRWWARAPSSAKIKPRAICCMNSPSGWRVEPTIWTP